MSVHTGMRLSEQYTCTWSQVHLDRRTIELSKTKNGSARTVHLNSDTVAAIESLGRANLRPGDPVSPVKGRATTRALVPSVSGRDGNHRVRLARKSTTFCSWLAMAGASIKEIQEAAGHKTIVMAARYSHLSPAHRLSVVERIAGTPE